MTRHVIIGNGPAGVVAAETLRRADAEAGITLIGDEAGPPYSRMAIPYLLMGKIDEAGTYLRKDADHFERLRIRMLLGRVAAIDSGARTLRLADGGILPYDRLLIASGAQPVRPPVPGIDLPKVLSCWTLADARAIVAGIGRGVRVLQMGAGFIGCIIMESLAARGPQLTVVEMGDRMVPRMLDAVAGAMLRRWCEARGVRVLTGRRVVAISSAGEALLVRLDDGQMLEVDVLISATGVKPNIAFLDGSGVAVNAGVLVDTTLQTSIAGIYAAGDVAEAVEFGTGLRVVNAIQPDAVEQARIAALNMAGQSATLPGTFVFNVLDTLGLISASFGQWQGVAGGETAQLLDETRFRYLRLAFDGDRLVGANCIGHTEHIGVLRGLIQGQVHLGEWKNRLLANPCNSAKPISPGAGHRALMEITLKLFASLSDYLPATARRTNALVLDVADGCSVASVIDAWALPPRLVHLVLVNGEFIPPQLRAERCLAPGDALAIWPPIAGG